MSTQLGVLKKCFEADDSHKAWPYDHKTMRLGTSHLLKFSFKFARLQVVIVAFCVSRAFHAYLVCIMSAALLGEFLVMLLVGSLASGVPEVSGCRGPILSFR